MYIKIYSPVAFLGSRVLKVYPTWSLVFAALRGPLDPSSTNSSSRERFLIKSSDA